MRAPQLSLTLALVAGLSAQILHAGRQSSVLDADRNGLRITESVRRSVASGTVVVVVKTGNGIEKEQAPGVGELMVDTAPEPLLQCGFDSAGEAVSCDYCLECVIEKTALATSMQYLCGQPCDQGEREGQLWSAHVHSCRRACSTTEYGDSGT